MREPTPNYESQLPRIGEKVSTFVRHKALKTKEYFGKINEKEFGKLLSLDFQEHLRENPPIEEVFSPQEALDEIKSLPKEKRRVALEVFKKRLITQRKAWGRCRRFIERRIEFDPDTAREKLVDLVEQFGKRYGFAGEHKQVAEQLLDGYYERRKRASETRAEYPDDAELISRLTKVPWNRNGIIPVTVGFMSLDVKVSPSDCQTLWQKASGSMIKKVENYGFAAQTEEEDPVCYIVIGDDGRTFNLGRSPVLEHERTHQKNSLFRAIFGKKTDEIEEEILLNRYREERDPLLKKAVLVDYFTVLRYEALSCVADEFLAHASEGYSPEGLLRLNSLFEQDGGSYDYLADARNSKLEKEDPLYQKTSQRMLVEEYMTTVNKSIKAFVRLIEKGKNSKQDAVALLTDRDFSDWPKTINRLLEQK